MIWFFVVFGFILGTVLGSFGLVLVYRSLESKSILGRSYCPDCKKNLRWYDLFPILSYLLLKGKCRYCHKIIPFEYPLVEFIMGLLIAYLFANTYILFQPLDSQYKTVLFIYDLIANSFLITVLVVVALTDLKKTIIPDSITFPSVIITFVLLVAIAIYKSWVYFNLLLTSPIGKLLVGKTSFFLQHVFWEVNSPFGNEAIFDPVTNGLIMALVIGLFFLALILITRGRGMGGGDLKLGILLGLFFGFPNSILVIMLAFFTGSIAALFLLLIHRKHFGQTIPFGPFLSLGGIIVIFWGPQILNWYLHLQIP